MDIRNIRMNIVQVCGVIVQVGIMVWAVATLAAKLNAQSEIMADIKRQQSIEAADNKIWKAKIEADLADLKVRTALLEARVNSLSYEK